MQRSVCAREVSCMVVLAAVVIALVGCGGELVQHDSPQAAYDTARAATGAKDYKAFCDCLTPESLDFMAGAMIHVVSTMKDVAAREPDFVENKQDFEASSKALDNVLAKHGVKENQLKWMQTMDPAASPEDMKAALAKLTTPIRDKPMFLVEIMNAMDAMEVAYTGKHGSMGKGMFSGRLEKIKVEGDRATARVVFNIDGKKMRAPMGFKKVNGSWLIEILVPVP